MIPDFKFFDMVTYDFDTKIIDPKTQGSNSEFYEPYLISKVLKENGYDAGSYFIDDLFAVSRIWANLEESLKIDPNDVKGREKYVLFLESLLPYEDLTEKLDNFKKLIMMPTDWDSIKNKMIEERVNADQLKQS